MLGNLFSDLVAVGIGRRISTKIYSQVGMKNVLRYLEKFMRDPVFAAELAQRVKGEPPTAFEKGAEKLSTAAEWVEPRIERPSAEAAEKLETLSQERFEQLRKEHGLPEDATRYELEQELSAKAKATREKQISGIKKGAGKYAWEIIKSFQPYMRERIDKLIRLGLLPGKREVVKETLEEDWQSGPPFDYKENQDRQAVEDAMGPMSRLQRPLQTPMPKAIPESILSQINTAAPPAPTPSSTMSPERKQLAQSMFPGEFLMAHKGGPVSRPTPKKPRQMVS